VISVNDCMTKAVRVARQKLGTRFRVLNEKFGPPSEHSALSSVHFLMEEYQEPPPVELVAPYKMSIPPLPVEQRTEYIEHPLGKRRLRVDLSFPRGHEGGLPSVIVSPGLGAHRSATRYVERYLAERGFLVVRPTHAGSDFTAVALKTPLGAFSRTELRRRISELTATLDALSQRRWEIWPSPGQVCMMGHSFGALTCGMFAGLRARSIEVSPPLSVDALIILSPYGNSFPTQRLGIDPGSFRDLSAPTLFVSGTKDDLWTLGRGSRGHLEPYLLCQAPVKSHLLIGGTRHGHFSEVLGWVRRDTKIMVNSTVTAFLDAHLRAESAGVRYLESHLPLVAFEHGSWVL
jgi:dienelactone hydrolase